MKNTLSILKGLSSATINILSVFALYGIIEQLIMWYHRNNLNKMPVYISYKNADIDFYLNGFDGYNYDITVDIIKFNNAGMQISNTHQIRLQKTDLNFIDIIKLISKTFCKKHNIFLKFSNSKTLLSKQSVSNLIRVLVNSQLITL